MAEDDSMRTGATKDHCCTLAAVLAAVTVGFSGVSNVAAQEEARSPSELIRYLTYQSDRPDRHGMVKGESSFFSCGPSLGEARDDRALTKSLVNFGSDAVPALEGALDRFEARGRQSPVASEASWLMLAYAHIKGPSAYPRLRRMYRNPGLFDYAGSLDGSIALAFGFTSYLSALTASQTHQQHNCVSEGGSTLSTKPCVGPNTEQPVRFFLCDRANEPRDSLDRLILAWLAGNRVSVEASLGPNPRSTLDHSLAGKSWERLRTQLRSGTSGHVIGIGYRFQVAGRWSEPRETLEEKREPSNRDDGPSPSTFEIETMFYDSSGSECGKRRLSFLATPEQGWYRNGQRSMRADGPTEYLIDNPDIFDLLRLVNVCAAERPLTNQVR